MAFFRSPIVRRIIYVIAFGLAVVRFANRSHSEPLPFNSLQSAETTQSQR